MKRNWLIVILSIVMALALTACGGGQSDKKPAADAQKKFAGKTIRFVAVNHPYTDAIKPLIAEFEKETGAKVNLESYAEDQLSQKLTVEFTSNSSSIDVFMNRPLQEVRLFYKNKWYEPLNKYINDTNYTPADWNWKDFPKSTVDAVTLGSENSICGVPIVVEWQMLFYRKDLFEKAGVKVPATFAELEAAAKKLNDPANGICGIVSRGQRGLAVTQFSSYLYGFGGDFIKGGKCVIDTP